jgi:orotidine-5'-phosphate decarboxylase
MSFQKKLDAIIDKNNSLVCVGLDSDFEKLPKEFKSRRNPQFEFNKFIIKQTHDLVCVYKPNPAFYEARGIEGIKDLKLTCEYLQKNHPEIPIIIDAKRGDIGNTNKGYAKFVFEYLGADAITVMPYMGIESLDIFYKYESKGVILGVHSSNPGAREFQELKIKEKPLYHIVAAELVKRRGNNPNAMMFVGATYPKELVDIRKIIGEMTILVPGVGAQGGSVKTFVTAGKNSKGRGLMINSSRGIIFADNPRAEAEKLRDEINKHII